MEGTVKKAYRVTTPIAPIRTRFPFAKSRKQPAAASPQNRAFSAFSAVRFSGYSPNAFQARASTTGYAGGYFTPGTSPGRFE